MATKDETLQCWHCGASLAEVVLPFRRLERCGSCEAELHVCRMCLNYDANLRDSCAQEMAEEVRNKESANFCDYFTPRPGAHITRVDPRARAARAQLSDLFGSGDDPAGTDAPGSGEAADQGETARRRLNDLFGGERD